MKIAWIVPGFSSDERDWCIPALLDLARVMATQHELHVFALRYPYRVDLYTVYGARVHALGGGHAGRWSAPRVWRKMIAEVMREHRQGRFDVLHAFWLWEPGVIAAWLKGRLNVRTVISLAGGELIDLPQIDYGYAGRRVYRSAMRWALRRVDVVTAGSRAGVEALNRHLSPARRYGDLREMPRTGRAVFAPLGVDVQMFSRRLEGWHLHPARRYGDLREMPRTPRTIVNVGSLQAVKGQADLIRAFRWVADRDADVRLKIIGDGPLRAELESLARELGVHHRVEFMGEVRRELLPMMYHAATLFVQASWHEAQGMALLEATACGLPIAGTAVGVLADLAPDAALGTPSADPIRLAQAMLSLLGDSARRHRLSAAAYERVVQTYSLQTAAERFIAIYGWRNGDQSP